MPTPSFPTPLITMQHGPLSSWSGNLPTALSTALPSSFSDLTTLLAQSGAGADAASGMGAVMGAGDAGPGLWWYIWWIVPLCAIAALVTAYQFYNAIMAESEGTDKMKEIAQAVREGAYAYLSRQYRTVAVFFVVVALVLAGLAAMGLQHWLSPLAFLTGGLLSALAGFLGMKTATSASARTAQAASESLDKGLRVAFRGGAVMGLCVVGLALLGICIWFAGLTLFSDMGIGSIAMVMLSMGLGASSMALFARVGGGIFTKAADVGADLVGKVEAGIPEDDPRNPATIADNVGDNVGDVAGMGADLFESYMGSILACSVLGASAAVSAGYSTGLTFNYVAGPMILAGLGILLSIFGMTLVRAREGADMKELIKTLDKGTYAASLLIIAASLALCFFMGLGVGTWAAITVGLAVGTIIGKATEYYTAAEYKPTQAIAEAAESGHGPLMISGLAEGMVSTWVPILVVAVGMIAAYGFAGGFHEEYGVLFGLYGVGIAAVGMLSTLGITLATDAYGPIADNAGGNAEMAGLGPEVRKRTDALDSLGNTTAAIGKGFAIGSAALTALALLASYAMAVEEFRDAFAAADAQAGQAVMVADDAAAPPLTPTADTGAAAAPIEATVTLRHEGQLIGTQVTQFPAPAAMTGEAPARNPIESFTHHYDIGLMNPKVLVGIFLGVMLVFLFSAMTMKAVGRAAMAMVQEVRRQFKDKPGIMEGTERPDYARCVIISTGGAQREMVMPTLLAIGVSIIVGLVLDVSGVMGLLVGGLCAGYAMAVFMANSGGAWDNAKKYIEEGHHGGKGSDPHKAAVVGDTVGDPFKDTSGPSLNILIKLMNIVSIVFAGLIVEFAPMIGDMLGIN